jgi:hypothetical protein
MNRSRIFAIAGLALLAVVAAIALSRKTEVAPQSFVNPGAYTTPATDAAPLTGMPAYASRPRVRVIEQAAPPPVQPRPTAYADYPARTSTRLFVTKERPKSHSVAIVAGSAGVGAAIGALAGGGKGAGIGALAGGGGGLVYDRLTHKKRVEVE